MNLEEQNNALITLKTRVNKLNVKNNRSSKIKKRRTFYQTKQPWQKGIVQTSNALPMMYAYLKQKYDEPHMRTAKLNQASEKKINFCFTGGPWIV